MTGMIFPIRRHTPPWPGEDRGDGNHTKNDEIPGPMAMRLVEGGDLARAHYVHYRPRQYPAGLSRHSLVTQRMPA